MYENALHSRESSHIYVQPSLDSPKANKATLRPIIFRGDSLHSSRELKRHGPGPLKKYLFYFLTCSHFGPGLFQHFKVNHVNFGEHVCGIVHS